MGISQVYDESQNDVLLYKPFSSNTRNNANVTHARLIHCEILMSHMKASTLMILINETWGIVYAMVSLSKACYIERHLYKWSKWMIQHKSVTWWFEMVKIARKGFEVLSKGEGQAIARWPRNLARVKKEVLAFSWGTNRTLMVTFKWRIKSWIKCWKWLDTFGVNS